MITLKPLTVKQRDLLEGAAAAYVGQYEQDEEAHRYLEEERGLDWPTIARLRLGIVREPISDSHRKFRGRICIPNISAAGHVVGLKFRLIEFEDDRVEDPEPTVEGEPINKPRRIKYDQPEGQIARLYNLQALRYAGTEIYVTEGEFDAMCIEDVGLAAVAIPGANHMGGSHEYRQRLFEGLDVVLCRDSDEAGEKLVKAMADFTTRVVSVEPFKDINQFYLAQGADALTARLKGLDHVE